MVRYERTTSAEAVQKVNHMITNPPSWAEYREQRVNLRWVDELGLEWASNFTDFQSALEFIKRVELVAINAEWY